MSQATDDLKRVTEHIEQERTIQRRQTAMQLSSSSSTQGKKKEEKKKRIFHRFNVDLGHVRIKEMIRTLEANARNNNSSLHSISRQRPLSQPCTLAETNAMLINNHVKTFHQKTTATASTLNSSYRSDLSMRSITKFVNEKFDSIYFSIRFDFQ